MATISVADALAALAAREEAYMRLLERSGFDVGMYKPEGVDAQTPHERDELYVIASGTGEFICQGSTMRFAQGDVLFAPAGAEHRFAHFTGDFATWVIFIGSRR